MSKFSDFLEYKKHQPEYKDWKDNKDTQLAKKVSYIKSNPIPKDDFNKDIERAKVVLNAVNVMDEYSQSKAEDMEEVTVGFESGIIQLGLYAGTILGGATLWLTKAGSAIEELFDSGKIDKKIIKKLAPTGIVAAATFVSSIVFSKFWSAKKQIEASRLGRMEAMSNDLASLNQFAILDEQQKNEVEKIADTINVDKKEANKAIKGSKGLGIIASFKTIFAPNKELKEKQKEFQAKIQNEKENVSSIQLSEAEELEAKKDKELIQTIVEKIDVASQDYAENTELATNTIQTIALGVGGGTNVIASKILKKLHVNNKHLETLTTVVSFAIPVVFAIVSAKIQKQASRVGRFKAKQELLNNPEQLVYIDEAKYQNQETQETKAKRKGFISNIIQIFKDNKEYNNYIKENNVRDIQLRKATDKIELTQEQKDRAKQLQDNVFKMFNGLDEKSQAYSESTEAIGDCVSELVQFISMIPVFLMTNKIVSQGSAGKMSNYVKLVLSLIPPLIVDTIVTKEQRNASRVANMEAIKEYSDYRLFASKNKTQSKNIETDKEYFKGKENIPKSPLLKQRLENK